MRNWLNWYKQTVRSRFYKKTDDAATEVHMGHSHNVIFYAAQSLPTSSSACAVRCFHLIRALRNCNYLVDVWSNTPGSRNTALLLPFISNRWPTQIRMLYEVLMGCELIVRLAIRRLSVPSTVVVFSSPPYVTCFLATHACRLFGLAYVWDARDVYPEVLFNFQLLRKDSIAGRLLALATKAIYRDALFVSTPSEAFSEIIRTQLDDDEKVILVRNGFDEDIFEAGVMPPSNSKRLVCINHGLLGRMHNIQLLLEVAFIVNEMDPQIEFDVIGSGPKQDLFHGEISDNVRYMGHKSYFDIPNYLAQADIGLAFIEDTEGTDGAFPVKVYEYIGAGLPVLVTPGSEAGRLVESMDIGASFANDEAHKIAEVIVELARRGDRFNRWRENVTKCRGDFFRSKWAAEFAICLTRKLS